MCIRDSLGSVSLRVLYEAGTTVRVARGRVDVDNLPVRVIVGIDGSTNSQAALNAVANRSWPKGTEVRLVAALATVLCLSGAAEAVSYTHLTLPTSDLV